MTFAKEYPDFFTATCLKWLHILEAASTKDIIVDSMRFLVAEKRVNVFAFCILNNHIHIIWPMAGENKREDVQRDLLKYTGQMILRKFKSENSPFLSELLVNAKDRKYQVWERNAFSFPLVSHQVIDQKFNYIHQNPVKAGLCQYPWEYKYSSADFYYNGGSNLGFLASM
jgi:putative transposase